MKTPILGAEPAMRDEDDGLFRAWVDERSVCIVRITFIAPRLLDIPGGPLRVYTALPFWTTADNIPRHT